MNIMFMGIIEMPVIRAKLLRPKYTPRIEVVSGVRPPNPIPISMPNRKNRGSVSANSSTTMAMDCRNEKPHIAIRMGMRSPPMPPITMKAVDTAVCTEITRPTSTRVRPFSTITRPK